MARRVDGGRIKTKDLGGRERTGDRREPVMPNEAVAVKSFADTGLNDDVQAVAGVLEKINNNLARLVRLTEDQQKEQQRSRMRDA